MFTVPTCIVCGEMVEGHELPLCEQCKVRYLTEKSKSCSTCGFPHADCRCGVTVDDGFYVVLHAVPYDPKVQGAVTRIVFNAKDIYLRDNFDFIAKECVTILKRRSEPSPDWLITWIPRRKSSERRIGHDQSCEIAKRVAAELGCEVRSLFNNSGRMAQKSQKYEGRLRNAFASYSLKKKANRHIAGRTVVLIDDLVTTGATLHATIALLKRAGADTVVPLTFAKTDSEFKRYIRWS